MVKKYLDIAYIKSYIRDYFEDKSNLYTTIGLVVFLLGWGGYKVYTHYTTRLQVKAQAQFNEALEVYMKALSVELLGQGSDDQVRSAWDDAELAFRLGYEQNNHAGIAPFFLMYQAQAFARQGDYQQAEQALVKAEKSVPAGSAWSYLIAVTKALITLNHDQVNGLESLKNLAYDEKNPLDLMALYYLGEYYYANQQHDEAKKAFNDVLVKETKNQLHIQSPWVALARERLEHL